MKSKLGESWRLSAVICFLVIFSSSSCQWLNGSSTSETKLGPYRLVISPVCENVSSHIETKKHADGSEELLTAQCDCGGTSILIRGTQLIVNGQTYGTVKDDDTISVRNGQVLVNSKTRSATGQN